MQSLLASFKIMPKTKETNQSESKDSNLEEINSSKEISKDTPKSSRQTKKNESKKSSIYAIVETSGKQFWFEENRYYDIDKLSNNVKDKISLESVLLVNDGKKISIGSVKLEVIDLCRPCRHLSEKLGRNDIIKEFLRKGGIRCQIMKNGKITLSDQIKII